MASVASARFVLQLVFFVSLLHFTVTAAARQLAESDQQLLFRYHNGPLLTGKVSINLIWYGKFKPSQRAIVTDFIASLASSSSSSSSKPTIAQPSVATWWKATEKYYYLAKSKKSSPLALLLGTQILDENYSLGKSLSTQKIAQLASKGAQNYAINVVLTASDVAVDGFCSSRCGTHGSSVSAQKINGKSSKFAYIWVGNSETQCPGQCAWPFHHPMYGPQRSPLVAPNNDVGLDDIVINLAGIERTHLGMATSRDQRRQLWRQHRRVLGSTGRGSMEGRGKRGRERGKERGRLARRGKGRGKRERGEGEGEPELRKKGEEERERGG